MDVAQLVVESLIAVIGLYLAHSITRQQRLRVAEQRIASYRELWGHMLVARPTRVEPPESRGPLTPEEAAVLYRDMTRWYFEGGDGMLLPHDTRELYLAAKKRLGAYASGGRDGGWEATGRRVMRDLSLLRSQLKNDLAIYGVFYYDTLDEGDRELLRAAELDPDRWGRPWYRRVLGG